MGDLPAQAHGAHGGGSGLQEPVRIGCDEGRRQSGELTAGAGDGGHLRTAVADAEGPLPVRYNVNGPSDGNDRSDPPGKVFGESHSPVQVLLRHLVRHIGVHPLGGAAAQGQGFDFGNIAPNHRKLHLIQQPKGSIRPQGGGPRPHRVQHHRMAQLIGPLPGGEHGRDGALVQGSNVDVQSTADGGDLHGILRVVRHNGRAAAGQQHIGAVVHGDIVGDVVDQGGFLADILKNRFKHGFLLPFSDWQQKTGGI